MRHSVQVACQCGITAVEAGTDWHRMHPAFRPSQASARPDQPSGPSIAGFSTNLNSTFPNSNASANSKYFRGNCIMDSAKAEQCLFYMLSWAGRRGEWEAAPPVAASTLSTAECGLGTRKLGPDSMWTGPQL